MAPIPRVLVHAIRACAVALGALLSTAAHADPIDDIVRAELARQHIPGLSLAIVRNGRIVAERGYGLANVELRAPVTPQTVFQSGSIGKQFTAALTLLLVADGKLALDAPISTWLTGVPPAWSAITVRHLLTHTSGLPASDEAIDLRRDYADDELLQSAFKLSLQAPPGADWSYSNVGYQLLGFLCSKVGGRWYGDQLRERIFAPLGMRTAIISERELVPHRAAGYDRVEGVLKNQEWVAPSINTTADGSLHVTAHDLALWSIALDTDRPLTAAMKDASWTPATLNDGHATEYGFGWFILTRDGHRLVSHGGSWQGFQTHILRLPEDRLAVIVLANRSAAQTSVIAERIAAHYVPDLKALGAASVSPAAIAATPLYLRGSLNEWGTRDRLVAIGPTSYEAQVPLEAGKLTFRIASEDWDTVGFGGVYDEPRALIGVVKPLEFRGPNLDVEIPSAGSYAFRLEVADPKRPRLFVQRVESADR